MLDRFGVSRLGSSVAGMLLAVVLAAFLGGCQTATSNDDIKPITLMKVREAMSSDKPRQILMIDSRSPKAYSEAHIPGAVNLKIADFTDRERNQDKRWLGYGMIVVYGDDPASGSAQALTKRLLEFKYDEVYMFSEGLSGWRRAGLPVRRLGPDGQPLPDPPGVTTQPIKPPSK